MKCIGCDKKIDINEKELINGEAPWYGFYTLDKCIKVICNDCIKDPKKKEEYKNDQSNKK